MTKATSATARGVDYQSYWFWLYAARMLRPESRISRVYYEQGEKGLDDVGVLSTSPLRHSTAGRRDIERFQVKFHVEHNAQVKGTDLADPAFVGSTVASFIERARDAIEADKARDLRTLAVFVTDWGPDPGDALREVLNAGTGLIDVDRIMAAHRGKFRELRDTWQSAAKLDDEALRELLGSIRLELAAGSMWRLDAELNDALYAAGLAPMDLSKRGRVYLDVARRFIEDGDSDFDADHLRAVLEEEELVRPTAEVPRRLARSIGVQSILRFAEDLAVTTDALLDLVPHFDYRRIHDDALWSDAVYPALEGWAAARARVDDGRGVELTLSCSTSIAVAAGHAFNPRSPLKVSLIQLTPTGRQVWALGVTGDRLDLSIALDGAGGTDGAVIVSASRAIAVAATAQVRANLASVGCITTINATTPRNDLLADGADAEQLALVVLEAISALRDAGAQRVHVLAAAPNAVMFMVGRGLRGRGPVTIYDYDLDNDQDGGYSPGISLPVAPSEATGA